MFFFINVTQENPQHLPGGWFHGWQLTEAIDEFREKYPNCRITLYEDTSLEFASKPYGLIGVSIPKTKRKEIFGESLELTEYEELNPQEYKGKVMSWPILETGEGLWAWKYVGTSRTVVFDAAIVPYLSRVILNPEAHALGPEFYQYDILKIKYWYLNWREVEDELKRIDSDITILFHNKLERPIVLKFELNEFKCEECGKRLFSIPTQANVPEDVTLGIYDELISTIEGEPLHCNKIMELIGTRLVPTIKREDVELKNIEEIEVMNKKEDIITGQLMQSELKGIICSRRS